MSQDELIAIMKAKNEADSAMNRRSWEQTREICFWTVISMQGTEDFKKAEDLFKFSWEKKQNEIEVNKIATKEEIETLVNKIKYGFKKSA
jgi:hypothetical protein